MAKASDKRRQRVVRRKILKWLLVFALFGIVFFPLGMFIVMGRNIYRDAKKAPDMRVGIVFGAGLRVNGTPSDILEDRLKTAAELYKQGKIKKIIVSGDNRFDNYNEPQAMYRYLAWDLGIPKEDIDRDYAGRRTYDSCARAKQVWNVSEAVLITQYYHLPRAMWTCGRLGVKSIGVSASLRRYQKEIPFMVREIGAIYKAFVDLYLWHPPYMK